MRLVKRHRSNVAMHRDCMQLIAKLLPDILPSDLVLQPEIQTAQIYVSPRDGMEVCYRMRRLRPRAGHQPYFDLFPGEFTIRTRNKGGAVPTEWDLIMSGRCRFLMYAEADDTEKWMDVLRYHLIDLDVFRSLFPLRCGRPREVPNKDTSAGWAFDMSYMTKEILAASTEDVWFKPPRALFF